MENHLKALSNLCRICGQRALKRQEIKLKKKAPKIECHAGLIKLYFAIDINNDVEGIHPTIACHACFTKLSDSKKANRTISLEKIEKDKKSVFTYEKHSDDECKVCEHYNKLSQCGYHWKTKQSKRKAAITPTEEYKTPEKKVCVEAIAPKGSFVSLERSVSSPLSKIEEKVHTSLLKRKLHFSSDKRTVNCKTGGQVSHNFVNRIIIF